MHGVNGKIVKPDGLAREDRYEDAYSHNLGCRGCLVVCQEKCSNS